MAAFGPVDDWGDGAAGPPSLRWAGLKRAWRMAGHLRAALAALVVVIVVARAVGQQLGWRDPPVVLTVVLIIAAVGLGVLLVLLAVLLSLGLLQAITGWPLLDDPEAWFRGLRWWAQLAVLPLLVAFVSVPAVFVAVGLIVGSYWMAVGK